ncbi:MAG: hypothetical protein HC836_12705 [Richelia sp. RM2_1_2]|nr:hypothetical protein [Richelia sp. RM2_1_2]
MLFLNTFNCFSQESLREKIIIEALKTEGAQESGRNNTDRGGIIDEMHVLAGFANQPNPWCGMAVYYWHIKAGVDKKNLPSSPAWSPSWGSGKNVYYKKNRNSLRNLVAQSGDTFTLYDDKSLKRIFHVGLVLRDLGSSVETIEGNTGAIAYTRETTTGRDGVFKKWRKKSSLYTLGYFGG